MPRGIDSDGGGAEEGVNTATLRRLLPRPLLRHILHFECAIEDAVSGFAASLPDGSRVLDAGAGEGQYRHHFGRQRYLGVDLGIGDSDWNYRELDVISDLQALPLRDACCDAVVNIVTLEHVQEPGRVVCELARCLRPGGKLLLVVPHEWEEHQQPHDYFRYTRYGVAYLLGKAGLQDVRVEPVGGYFRLLARRLLNGVQFFPALLKPFAMVAFGPAALLLPLLDGMDTNRNFTLGFICTARK